MRQRPLRPEAAIPILTSKQRAHLRKLAHHLDPIVHVGADGVSDAVVQAVEDAFNTRELLKIKVLKGSTETPRDAGDALAARTDGHVVQVIGRTVVLYRPAPESPTIDLPD